MNVNAAIRDCKSGKNREENMNGLIQKFQPIKVNYICLFDYLFISS